MRFIAALALLIASAYFGEAKAQGLMTQCWAVSKGTTWVIPHGRYSSDICRKLAVACTGDQNVMAWHSTMEKMVIAPIYPQPPLRTCLMTPGALEQKAKPVAPKPAPVSSPPTPRPRPSQPAPATYAQYDPKTYRHPLDINNDGVVEGLEDKPRRKLIDPNRPATRGDGMSRPSLDQAPAEWKQQADQAARDLARCNNGLMYRRCHAACLANKPDKGLYTNACDHDCICNSCKIVFPEIVNIPRYSCPGGKYSRY